MKKKNKILLFLLIMILSITNIGIVKADTKNIEVDSINVKDKSGTIIVVDPVLESNEITSNITFNQIDDFVTFELTIKNNESEKYKIKSITDNNTNENIKTEYSFNEDYIGTGETSTVTIKLTYGNKLINQNIDLNDLTITLTLEKESGNSSEIIINNPATGDNILMYLLFLIISVTGLIFISKKVKYKGIKVGSIVFLLSLLILPFAVLASEKYEIKLKFTDIVISGEFETYNISIDKDNGNDIEIRPITYGEKLGDLGENPTKEGYTFDKYEDSDGNTVTEDTIITKETEITAKYTINTYTVTFNTNGGSSIDLQTINYGNKATKPSTNPTKSGYTFDNWYEDSAFTTVFDFDNTVITSDTVIYAKFIDPCNGFSTDSWSTIKNNLESDSDYYAVGCEKEVELDMDDDEINESYTVRLANTSTPEVCSTEGYSQTACGLVIEFVDIVGTRNMNSTNSNAGGWKETEMVTYLNSDFYNKLPSSLQSVIIPTYPIVSGSGSERVSNNITEEDTGKNKIYLLSTREVGFNENYDNKNDDTTDTRILDYYNYNASRIKKNLSGSAQLWWLRSADSISTNFFYYVYYHGNAGTYYAVKAYGVAPAFRIGN